MESLRRDGGGARSLEHFEVLGDRVEGHFFLKAAIVPDMELESVQVFVVSLS